MKKLKLLVANAIWPSSSHSTLSANVILFELLKSLAQQPGVSVSFLKIERAHTPPPTPPEVEGIAELKNNGIEFMETCVLPLPQANRSRFAKLCFPKLQDYYPETLHAKHVADIVRAHGDDALLIPLSEWATALCADIPMIKYAFYGNPDPKQGRATLFFSRAHEKLSLSYYVKELLRLRNLERFHLKQMMKYELLGNVAANDAEYYTRAGHPNAFYVRNVWIDRFPEWERVRKKMPPPPVPTIIGNVGRMGGTANTYGLEILGRDLLPALREEMGELPYKIDLFGVPDPHPAIRTLLDAPEITIRGFVKDIDAEIMRSAGFLCLNNASLYKVVHTRFLHAWSLGCCVIAHADAALSMPELINGENALLGTTPKEIATLIKMALVDPALRHRIGAEGYKSFKKHFTADAVAPQIIEKIRHFRATHPSL